MDEDRTVFSVVSSALWPDRASAKALLRHLLAIERWPATRQEHIRPGRLGPWLIREGLGPLAHARFKDDWPALAGQLQGDLFLATAESSLHFERLERVVESFAAARLPLVLLKGASLALSTYPDPALRPMSDVDLLVPDQYMSTAIKSMLSAGFHVQPGITRPPDLQMLSDGGIGFSDGDRLVELHLSPFSGWWLQRVAAMDNAAIWERIEPLDISVASASAGLASKFSEISLLQLSPEDTVIHLAVHDAVNHQFGLWAVRSLVDIAMVAKQCEVSWHLLAERARKWRLATAIWTVLDLLDSLIGLQEMEPALNSLRPSRVRRALLRQLVSPESILSGRDLRQSRWRYLLLLSMVDRPRDMLRLIFRTLWPEREWLDARYPDGGVSRWQHLWRVLRHGEI